MEQGEGGSWTSVDELGDAVVAVADKHGAESAGVLTDDLSDIDPGTDQQGPSVFSVYHLVAEEQGEGGGGAAEDKMYGEGE